MASSVDPSTPPRTTPTKDDGPLTSPATPTGRTQALKDLKLTIEYKHLKQNAPGGIIVTPSFDDLRRWHGVIFVRKGPYQGGIFKFIVQLPRQYNDHNVFPEVRFQNEVSNPFVTPMSRGGGSGAGEEEGEGGGLLDLRHAYPKWDPTRHFIVTVLTFVKKIFYLKDEDLDGYDSPANHGAATMFLTDKVNSRFCCCSCFWWWQ